MRLSIALATFASLALSSQLGAEPSYRVAAQLRAGDGGWDLLTVAPSDRRVYVAHGDGVTAFDLTTGKATDRIVAGSRVHAALAIPGTHEVLSTNGETNNAFLFDGRSGRIRATIPTGVKPDAAAFDPLTRTIWIMDPGSGEITIVDPRSAKVLGTILVGGSLELAVADGHGRMFVNVEDKNEVVVLDTRKRKIEFRFPLEGCDGPTGIALDPKANQIVSACANKVAIVSSPDGHQVARLPIGRGADGAAYNPRTGEVLVPAGHDGNVTILRLGSKPEVVGEVRTAISARTIAIDPSTGRAYLPSATLAPAPAGERPKALPGTFRLLVIAPQ
jgi:DNA-binding beta-propeller fold protein YncE